MNYKYTMPLFEKDEQKEALDYLIERSKEEEAESFIKSDTVKLMKKEPGEEPEVVDFEDIPYELLKDLMAHIYSSIFGKNIVLMANYFKVQDTFFNNFEINLSKRLSKFKIYDTIVLENKFKIFSDFYLPISLVKITNKEIKEEQKNYNVEQAKDLGIEQLQEELDNEIEDKSKVVNKIINTYEKEDGIEVYVTYEVLEDIGTNEKIVF